MSTNEKPGGFKKVPAVNLERTKKLEICLFPRLPPHNTQGNLHRPPVFGLGKNGEAVFKYCYRVIEIVQTNEYKVFQQMYRGTKSINRTVPRRDLPITKMCWEIDESSLLEKTNTPQHNELE